MKQNVTQIISSVLLSFLKDGKVLDIKKFKK